MPGFISFLTIVLLSFHNAEGFAVSRLTAPTSLRSASTCSTVLDAVVKTDSVERQDITGGRREFMLQVSSISAFVAGMAMSPSVASAIPMVSTDEFGVILRDSPLSIEVVEFSGPKSETVTVKLVDGTMFGIKDVVESPIDPRSPLKVAATCRENNVKTKFLNLESILASAPKKKKIYTNERVQIAAEKEKARLERMRQDEEDRLAAVRKMEEDEAIANSKNAIEEIQASEPI